VATRCETLIEIMQINVTKCLWFKYIDKTRWLQTEVIIFESFLTSFELRAIFEAGRENRLKSNHYNNQI